MVAAVTVSVFDLGPVDLTTGAIAEEKGIMIAAKADVTIARNDKGWKGTFLSPLPLRQGGHYWIETAAKRTAQIQVTAASVSENSFDGLGTCPLE